MTHASLTQDLGCHCFTPPDHMRRTLRKKDSCFLQPRGAYWQLTRSVCPKPLE